MNLEEDINYRKALKQAQEFHSESLGCTEYFGKTENDRIYPRQLNTIILLVLELHKKVDYLTNQIRIQKPQEQSASRTEIEALSLQLKNLPVETKLPTTKTARNIFGIKE